MAIHDPVIAEQTPAADFTIAQKWDRYTPQEHDTWTRLYDQQISILQDRVVPEFYEGLKALDLNAGGIPDLEVLNKALRKLTGWEVIMVPHLVPDAIFFEHLAHRRFPAGRFMRQPDQMDYIEEPDVFHDVFGHVPLLTNPVFADYMQAYGQGGLRALQKNSLDHLARLYWYTVEFGLMNTDDGFKIYGAGIASSRTESLFSVESPSPNRLQFDLLRVMQTLYRIDDFQQVYFAINSFQDLFDATQQDFGPIYKALEDNAKEFGLTDILSNDTVLTRGTQVYAQSGGRLKAAS